MPITPSITLDVYAMTPSESREAAYHGTRALTPILSGAISGGIVGVAWIIGIIFWLYKRNRRARRARALGYRSYREFLDPPKSKDPFIIPPDPAVIKGQVQPGQKIVVEKGKEKTAKHAHTFPTAPAEEDEYGESRNLTRGDKDTPMPPEMEPQDSGSARTRARYNSYPPSNVNSQRAGPKDPENYWYQLRRHRSGPQRL